MATRFRHSGDRFGPQLIREAGQFVITHAAQICGAINTVKKLGRWSCHLSSPPKPEKTTGGETPNPWQGAPTKGR